jgi:predicted xylose isomerase-like sugar epimerase
MMLVSGVPQAKPRAASTDDHRILVTDDDVVDNRGQIWWGEDLGAPRVCHLQTQVRAGFEPLRGGGIH